MSTHLSNPTSKLICFGGAKACTNISVGLIAELNPDVGFSE